MHQHLVFLFTIELSSGQEPFSCLSVGHTQMTWCMQEIKFQSENDMLLTDILECIKSGNKSLWWVFLWWAERFQHANLLGDSESKHPGRSSAVLSKAFWTGDGLELSWMPLWCLNDHFKSNSDNDCKRWDGHDRQGRSMFCSVSFSHLCLRVWC